MQLGQTMSLLFLIQENTNLQLPLLILFLLDCACLVARRSGPPSLECQTCTSAGPATWSPLSKNTDDAKKQWQRVGRRGC